jgi:predicted nucleic acid-binding protein
VLIGLDSNIVIYAVERIAGFGARALAYLAAGRARGDEFAVSDLTRMECRVRPMGIGDSSRLQAFDAFFRSVGLRIVLLSTPVVDRATEIRARHRFKVADSLNLAAAMEARCDVFLTNDLRLSRFPDLRIEALP